MPDSTLAGQIQSIVHEARRILQNVVWGLFKAVCDFGRPDNASEALPEMV